MDIYKEEYIREQARIDARNDALPKPRKKSRLLTSAVPALVIWAAGYAVYALGLFRGLNPRAFLELDFVGAALVLAGLFLWARRG